MLSQLDSNDSRMQQVWYADGKLFGALDTGVKISGDSLAGHQLVRRSTRRATRSSARASSPVGQRTSPIRPSPRTPAGSGVMAFTLVGENDFPSAAYAAIDATGVGTDPDRRGRRRSRRTASPATRHSSATRPDPAGATTAPPPFDGTDLWIASEYIGQTCTLGEWLHRPDRAVRRHPHRARQLGHADQPGHPVTRGGLTAGPPSARAGHGSKGRPRRAPDRR